MKLEDIGSTSSSQVFYKPLELSHPLLYSTGRIFEMFYNNPFEAWGQGSSSSTVPPAFGALPYPSDPSNVISFFFTSYSPNIFNCTVVGPKAQPYYTIVTDNQMPGYTVLKNMEGKNVSLVEWQQHPSVEIRGMVSKQTVGNWLRLSPNRE